ncbi:MAG: bifunctional diguanylate cyclase/phosphodiesterase [Pseudomonadota bacterium]
MASKAESGGPSTREARGTGSTESRLICWSNVAVLVTALLLLHLTARYHYLLFHHLVEVFRVVTLGCIFIVAWHTRRWATSGLLMIIGMAALPIGGLELLHSLAYKGMGIFADDANLPTQLWSGFRLLEAGAFLAAVLHSQCRPSQASRYLLAFSLVGASIGLLILTGHFPDSYIEGQGLTRFKVVSEYITIGLFLASGILLVMRHPLEDRQVMWLMLAALLCNALSGAAFTRYADVFGMANEVGHYLLLISTYLVYRAILASSLTTPFRLLFREIKQNERHLEDLVAQRTEQLRHSQILNDTFIARSPVSMFLTDDEGHFILANPALARLIGKPSARLIGCTAREVMNAEDAEQLMAPVEHARRRGRPQRVRLRLTGPERCHHLDATYFPLTLEQARTGCGVVVRNITQQEEAQRRIEFLARHDALTQLPNRHTFAEQANQWLARHGNDGTLFLIYLDLDNFKDINDSLGHTAGDQLLCTLATRLRQLAREHDLLSRYGGDEFMLLIDRPDRAGAEALAGELLGLVAQPMVIEQRELVVSASVGIANAPRDGLDVTTLFRNADLAMYAAKTDGRNTLRFFDQGMQQQVNERLTLLGHLRNALSRNELEVYYQPQVCLQSGALVGLEALLRWRHPELGWVTPDRFIPVAEESALILPIGEWVLREACRQVQAWRQAGMTDVTLAVNLSAVQLQRTDIARLTDQVLEESGLPAERLELELTEGILLQQHERLDNVLQRLKALGVQLAIDDFGTGYSNLTYLQRFAVDKLKIDQSFVLDMDRNPENRAIVAAILQMAHGLKLTVIAEGAGSAEVVATLRALDCDMAQGFHYARPMPAGQLMTWWHARQAAAREDA